jgi:hypothetical protein
VFVPGGVHTPNWHVQVDTGGVPRHELDVMFVFVLGVVCVGVEFGAVHEPWMHVHPAPGCTPRQFPAPPPPVGAAVEPAPLVLAALGSNCHVPFWQTQSGPGASPEHVEIGVPPPWLCAGAATTDRRLVPVALLGVVLVITLGAFLGASASSRTVHAAAGAASHQRYRLYAFMSARFPRPSAGAFSLQVRRQLPGASCRGCGDREVHDLKTASRS